MSAIIKLRNTVKAIVLIVVISFSHLTIADSHKYESADELRASDVLPKSLREGPHHKVEKTVQSDGYLNYYRISSDYGEFDAVSTAMLKTRVGEIEALAELDELSKTEVFIKAAADAGVGQLKTLQQFATKPVETVVGIPSGIGRMFKRYSRQADEAVDATKEFVAGEDEEQEAETGDGDEETTTDKAVDITESFFGVSGAQRAWAQKLGPDPYSRTAVLLAAIKEVAWAARRRWCSPSIMSTGQRPLPGPRSGMRCRHPVPRPVPVVSGSWVRLPNVRGLNCRNSVSP